MLVMVNAVESWAKNDFLTYLGCAFRFKKYLIITNNEYVASKTLKRIDKLY